MLCILVDELRLSRFHQILNYLKSSFLPTLLKPISAGTHTQAQPLCQIKGNFWQIFYHFNWMVNLGLQ